VKLLLFHPFHLIRILREQSCDFLNRADGKHDSSAQIPRSFGSSDISHALLTDYSDSAGLPRQESNDLPDAGASFWKNLFTGSNGVLRCR
jgi:hypothetical protein